MTSITWAGPRCVQEAAAILGPQNRTQGRCEASIGQHYTNMQGGSILLEWYSSLIKHIFNEFHNINEQDSLTLV